MFLMSKVLPLLLLLWDLLRRRRWLLNWIPSAKGLDSTSRTLYRAW